MGTSKPPIAAMAAAASLQINCLSGQRFKDTELLGKMDPYLVLELSDGQKQSIKPHKSGGTAPTWNEAVRFSQSAPSPTVFTATVLTIRAFDRDTFGNDDFIGEAKLQLGEFYNVMPSRGAFSVPIHDDKKRFAGLVFLDIVYGGSPLPPKQQTQPQQQPQQQQQQNQAQQPQQQAPVIIVTGSNPNNPIAPMPIMNQMAPMPPMMPMTSMGPMGPVGTMNPQLYAQPPPQSQYLMNQQAYQPNPVMGYGNQNHNGYYGYPVGDQQPMAIYGQQMPMMQQPQQMPMMQQPQQQPQQAYYAQAPPPQQHHQQNNFKPMNTGNGFPGNQASIPGSHGAGTFTPGVMLPHGFHR